MKKIIFATVFLAFVSLYSSAQSSDNKSIKVNNQTIELTKSQQIIFENESLKDAFVELMEIEHSMKTGSKESAQKLNAPYKEAREYYQEMLEEVLEDKKTNAKLKAAISEELERIRKK
jgi:hypothetical protein